MSRCIFLGVARTRTSRVGSPQRTVLSSRFPSRGGGHDCRRRAARGQRRRTHGVQRRFREGCGEVGGAAGGASALIATTFRPTAVALPPPAAGKAMSKRAKIGEPEAPNTTVGSYVEFRIEYEQIKQLPIGKSVLSDIVSAGGHLWRIVCYPHGKRVADKGEYISIFLLHIIKSRSFRVKFESFIAGNSILYTRAIRRTCATFPVNGDEWGWPQFIKRTDVEKKFLKEGHVTFACTIMVMDDSAIPVPPSDIGTHLGRLLDHTDGTDVSFIVDDEKFPAHRAVLAARSPVFRAEVFGSMAEATMSSITLHDITPATFKAMLRFIYTDELPEEDEPEDSSIEMFQNLLAAADRYALDRLKFVCAQKLWDKVSVDTVATILACAETYNCHELKNNCIDFFAEEGNFKEAIFTDGYALLVLKFPSITAELKKRIRA